MDNQQRRTQVGQRSTVRAKARSPQVRTKQRRSLVDHDMTSSASKDVAVFYVYVYLDPRKPGNHRFGSYCFGYEPFYIGFGKGRRRYDHLSHVRNGYKEGNRLKQNKIKKILSLGLAPVIQTLKTNLSEGTASKIEQNMIMVIGRLDLGMGPLTNLTNGGEGSFGRILSESTKAKIKANHAPCQGNNGSFWGKRHSESTKKLIGLLSSKRRHTEATKSKIRQKMLGRVITPEHRRKLKAHLDRVCPFRKRRDQ